MGESSDFGTQQIEQKNKPCFREVAFPTGRFVVQFLASRPDIARTRDVWPNLLVANEGRPEAIFIFPGFAEFHQRKFMKGKTVGSLIGANKDTIATVRWMNVTHAGELIARGIADFLEQTGSQGVKLFGTSHGGYFSLKLVQHFNSLKKEGFSIPVGPVVIVAAPTSRGCLKRKLLLSPKLALGKGYLFTQGVVQRVIRKSLYVPSVVAGSRSDAVRISDISPQPFLPGDFPDDFKVHYFTTDSRSGKTDKLIDQPRAIRELGEAGVGVVLHEFGASSTTGHSIHSDDILLMNEKLLEIFTTAE